MRGLALSGGGARGLAHIGVLEVFLEAGLDFQVVAGTSMGATVGALFAAGRTPGEMLEMARKTPWLALLGLSPREGLFSRRKLKDFLAEHLPPRFEDLKRPLVVTAVDVATGRLVFLTQGSFPAPFWPPPPTRASWPRWSGRAGSSLTEGFWTTCPWTGPGSWGLWRSTPRT